MITVRYVRQRRRKPAKEKTPAASQPPRVEQVTKFLSMLGAFVAVFYAVGFTIVQSYIKTSNVEGMFWFTREYYHEAGAKFLLEMVRAPLVNFYIFIPLLLMLLWLVPRAENLQKGASGGYQFAKLQVLKVFLLLLSVSGTYAAMLSFSRLMGTDLFSRYILWPFHDPIGTSYAKANQSSLFFVLAVSVGTALSVFLMQIRKYRNEYSQKEGCGLLSFSTVYYVALICCLGFVVIVPITYGVHIYDMKIVPVEITPKMEEKIGEQTGDGFTFSNVWLLGEFSGKYLFFAQRDKEGYDKSDLYAPVKNFIVSFDKDKVARMDFDLTQGGVSYLRETSSPRERQEPGMEDKINYDKIMEELK